MRLARRKSNNLVVPHQFEFNFPYFCSNRSVNIVFCIIDCKLKDILEPTLDISIVVPLYNEDESLKELAGWIDKTMVEAGLSYEVIFVDDGSTDDSWNVVEGLIRENSALRGLKFRRNYGKSAALNEGFKLTKGEVVITMDADLQDSPEEVPEMRKMIVEDGYQLISGWKKKRYDGFIKNKTSKVYNWTTRRLSGIRLHDFNCGLKAYHWEVVKNITVEGEMHRYIPIIAKSKGFSKIGEKVVIHQSRKYGVSKFGMNRFVNGFLDLFTITFISRFGKKPMHFFGLLGTLFFVIGFGISLYLSIAKLFFDAYRMTERPVFYLAIVCMIIGTQLFLTGFIAELIIRSKSEKESYQIEKVL